MAFIPVADTAEVVVTYTYPGNKLVKNVYNVREASIVSWDPTTLNLLLDTFENWITTEHFQTYAQQVPCTNLSARDLTVVDSYVVERAMSTPGAKASPPLPANVTWAVKAVTGLAGRSFRGRSYFIGLTEADVTDNTVAQAVADSVIDSYNYLMGQLSFGSRNMVVVSRYTGGAPRVTGVATDITSWQYIDRRVDTQRRRLNA